MVRRFHLCVCLLVLLSRRRPQRCVETLLQCPPSHVTSRPRAARLRLHFLRPNAAIWKRTSDRWFTPTNSAISLHLSLPTSVQSLQSDWQEEVSLRQRRIGLVFLSPRFSHLNHRQSVPT